MKISSLMVGLVGTNCYILTNEDTNEAIIIDPGDQAKSIINKCDEMRVKPVAILLTHGHFDHVMAGDEVANHYGIKIYIHEDDFELIADPHMNSGSMINRAMGYRADKKLVDGQKLDFAGFDITVIHTPGHTPGGACFYFEKEGKLICGDTLFCGSVGRTDLPGGSQSTLVNSLREKIMKLPDQTACYPGHGEPTTISYERQFNPFI